MDKFLSKKGYICDMDGVIYHGNRILPGVPEFVDWLYRENKKFLFLTNNSSKTPRELHEKLARMAWRWMSTTFIPAVSPPPVSSPIRPLAHMSLPSATPASPMRSMSAAQSG